MSVILVEYSHKNANQSKPDVVVAVPSIQRYYHHCDEYAFKVAYKVQVLIINFEGIYNGVEK